MFNFFGRKKKREVNPNDTIINLKQSLDLMEKRERYLEIQLSELKEQARESVKKGDKKRAVFMMKKSKIIQKHLDDLWGTKLSLETQIATLSQAVNNKETIEAIKMARSVLRDMEKNTNPDEVGELMDDIEEQTMAIQEVSSILSQPLGGSEDNDEELLAELEAELDEEKILEPPSLPSVPEKELVTEEKELKELEAFMNS